MSHIIAYVQQGRSSPLAFDPTFCYGRRFECEAVILHQYETVYTVFLILSQK